MSRWTNKRMAVRETEAEMAEEFNVKRLCHEKSGETDGSELDSVQEIRFDVIEQNEV